MATPRKRWSSRPYRCIFDHRTTPSHEFETGGSGSGFHQIEGYFLLPVAWPLSSFRTTAWGPTDEEGGTTFL